MKTLKIQLRDIDLRKLMKNKMEEKEEWLKKLSHEEYLSHLVRKQMDNIFLQDTFDTLIGKSTARNLAPFWGENFYGNISLQHMVPGASYLTAMLDDEAKQGRESLKKRRDQPKIPDEILESCSIANIPKEPETPSLVVAAGPSIREHKHIELIAKRGWRGIIMTTDRMLRPLLEAGVSPANGFSLYVASVDGHRIHIPEMYEGLDAEGVTGLFCSTVAPQTVMAARDAGVKVYWFHGMLDNYYAGDSICSWMQYMVKAPVISAGGNVGATCWTLSLYLQCSPVVFIGLDLGYTPHTRIEDTAYYHTLPEDMSVTEKEQLFNHDYNPDYGVEYYQDPVFKRYKDNLLKMLETHKLELEAGKPGIYPLETINATGGGSMHHPSLIKGMQLEEVLDLYGER